jgi:hypothetical protein
MAIAKIERAPRPTRYNHQLVALVDQDTSDRVRRVGRATNLSMAEVLRQIIGDGLAGIESYYHAELLAARAAEQAKPARKGRKTATAA